MSIKTIINRIVLISSLLILTISYTQAGALLTVTLDDTQSSKITWQCADTTECVERIIARVEEHGYCDERVQEIKITKVFIDGFDDPIKTVY